MKTGFRGTFVISWSQTKLDGQEAAPIQALDTGAVWSWRGEAVRVDGSHGLLRLEKSEGDADIRLRAARMVRRLAGAAVADRKDIHNIDVDDPLMESGFVLTNGEQSYSATLIEVEGSKPLLMFLDEIPPAGRDLWVVHSTVEAVHVDRHAPDPGGVICFTPGTMIRTPQGARRIEEIREGETVLTKDSGPQEVRWIGSRRMSGARLFAMPRLRPIRIRAGALGIERPDQELLVSPEHRMLVQGAAARALFNTPEVLVAARDLINGRSVVVDTAMREVTYVHMLLPRHEVIWANGVETESFHPASAPLSSLESADLHRLLEIHPELRRDPDSFGGFARRNLSASEAAILLHDAA